MNIRIETKHKPYLGHLIAYYRKLRHAQTNSQRYIINKFRYDEQGIMICSRNVLLNLLKGQVYEDDELYYSLLANLDLHYKNDVELIEFLSRCDQRMLKASMYHNFDDMKEIIKQAIVLLQQMEGYVIYQEYRIMYKTIYDFYVCDIIHHEHFQMFAALHEIIPDNLKLILLDIKQFYYSRIVYNNDALSSVLNAISKADEHCIMVRFHKAYMEFRKYRYLESLSIASKLLIDLEKSDNTYYLCKTYNLLGGIYHYLDKQTSIDYYDKVIKLLYNNEKRSFDLSAVYKNQAMNYLELDQYETTLYYLSKSLELDKMRSIVCVPYIFHCLLKLHKSYDTPEFKALLTMAENFRGTNNIVFDYSLDLYRCIFDYDEQSLHKIMNKLQDCISFFRLDFIFFDIMKETLSLICKRNKKYALYFRFVEKTDKLLATPSKISA